MGALTNSKIAVRLKAIPNISLYLLILLEIVLVAALEPKFLSLYNFSNIITQMSTLLIISLGITFVVVCGCIDLSLGSMVSVISVVTALVLVKTNSIFLGCLAGFLTGCAFGTANGLLIAYMNIQPFAATLGTMSICSGLALVLCDGDSVRSLPAAFGYFGNGKVLGVPFQIIVMVVLVLLCYFLLQRTPFGVQCYATGGNSAAASMSGVNVKRAKLTSYIICGAMAAVTSIIATSRISSGSPTLGAAGVQMQAIAAAIIGGASIKGGKGTIVGTLLGVVFISVMYNGANMIGVSPYIQDVLIGSIIVLSAWADMYKAKKLGT